LSNRRVVISGVGLITPLGIGVDETWRELCAGKSGIGEITRFDTSDFQTKIAGEVKDFHPEDFLTQKDARRTTTFIAYAVATTRMALEDANLVIDQSNADRVGVFVGCGLGGLASLEETNRILETRGPNRVSPFFIPMMIGNMAAGMISMQFGAKGPNACMATACAAGSHSIGDAFKLVQQGRADAMISGGVESVITASCIAGFNAMKALSTRNDAPQKASRPFDRDRDGFVVGEGCGIVILETLEAARERGAHIYAEICGYGMSGDGYHMTAPSPDGEGAARCMLAAINDAGISYKQIDYINAHGTATKYGDELETQAMKTVFGSQAEKLAISSTKSMTGHLLGAAGGLESVVTILALKEGVVPPTINLESPDPECDLDYVPNEARRIVLKAAMTNSFGFGGTNACLLFKRFEG